jgi:hypothetical protein
MFRLEIETSNAAFEDGAATETARILRAVAKRIEQGDLAGEAWDSNGNRVGTYELNGRRSRR